MAFTQAELDNIANAALDYYIKKQPFLQTIQDKPLLDAMVGSKKSFPGGKGMIDLPVKGDYTTQMVGYSHDDQVTYANPANIKRVFYPWKEEHAGLKITGTELKIDGISVTSEQGIETSEHSGRDMTVLVGLLEDKLEDLGEGISRSLNNQAWGDGTTDVKALAGVKSFIFDTPAVGVTGGLDRATVAWWRNRALVGANKIVTDVAKQTLTKTLRSEVRQLRRFGGRPSLLLAGSGFIASLESEVFEKGYYSDAGFTNAGKTDIGMADISMRGVGTFQYDPTLDDRGETNRCYFIDPKHLYLYAMQDEWMKQHSPARPEDRYVYYKAVTVTGAFVADQLNAQAVYEAQPPA